MAFKPLNLVSSGFTPYLNTGTLLDVATGAYLPGFGDKFLLNGGLSTTQWLPRINYPRSPLDIC